MIEKIEFHRVVDNVVYTFQLDGQYNGKPKWRRKDKNIIIVYIDHVGWCVLDEDLNQVSWPFIENKSLEIDLPPAGKWLSWKNGKSYIYDLILL